MDFVKIYLRNFTSFSNKKCIQIFLNSFNIFNVISISIIGFDRHLTFLAGIGSIKTTILLISEAPPSLSWRLSSHAFSTLSLSGLKQYKNLDANISNIKPKFFFKEYFNCSNYANIKSCH